MDDPLTPRMKLSIVIMLAILVAIYFVGRNIFKSHYATDPQWGTRDIPANGRINP